MRLSDLAPYLNVASVRMKNGQEALCALDWDYPLGRFGVLSPDTPFTRQAYDLVAEFLLRPTATLDAELRNLPRCFKTTSFRERVYRALGDIPFGKTVSYKELARLVGSAPRAVGQAVKRNPLAFVVPCHRVICADGGIGGYFGVAGVDVKRKLLERERA